LHKKRYLVTTAIESTWPDSQPVLFLGEWCKLYSRKEKWINIESETARYHWDNSALFYSDYKYLIQLLENLLEELTVILNSIHKVDHTVQYWRILVGPWLGYFVQILADRWANIQIACKEYDISGTTILKTNDVDSIPYGMTDFIRRMVTDRWNHEIYAAIITNYTTIRYTTKKEEPLCQMAGFVSSDSLAPKVSIRSIAKKTVHSVLKFFYFTAAKLLVRPTDGLLISTYVPRNVEIKYQLKNKQFPYVPVAPVLTEMSFKPGDRDWVLPGTSISEFESCVRWYIAKQIPAVYLEEYKTLIEHSKKLSWPQQPKYIWTSNEHMSNDIFKAWAAAKVEAGSPLIIGQHGGHYGIGKWLFLEDHEMAICNFFLSWGWTDGKQLKIKPVGQLKSRKPFDIDHASNPVALVVTTAVPRYSYFMLSASISKQYLDDMKDQLLFVSSLPEEIRNAVVVRLNQADYGWDLQKRWRDNIPDAVILDSTSKMDDLIQKSRIYISTYNATTFLESLTMNVPTVIFWNMDRWQIRDSAIPYFDELKRVGIFHESPLAAAQHVAAIWDDVNTWWKSEEVKKVVSTFCKRYSNIPHDLQDTLKQTLAEVID